MNILRYFLWICQYVYSVAVLMYNHHHSLQLHSWRNYPSFWSWVHISFEMAPSFLLDAGNLITLNIWHLAICKFSIIDIALIPVALLFLNFYYLPALIDFVYLYLIILMFGNFMNNICMLLIYHFPHFTICISIVVPWQFQCFDIRLKLVWYLFPPPLYFWLI